jgi:ribosomal protein S27E
MSNKKDRIASLLAKMDNSMLDKLEEALGDSEAPEEKPTKHEIQKKPNRRRGRGKKRRQEDSTDLEEIEEQRPRRNKRGKRSRPRTQERKISKGSACRTLEYDIDSPRENRFLDFIGDTSLDAEERQELKDASKLDKNNKRKTKKQARPSPMIWVRCRGCGEEEEVSASMVHNVKRYKCNDCSATACG